MQKTARASKKQRELLAFIDAFIKGNNYGPSYREIMRALGYKSVSTVAVHVDGLITAGYLRKKDHSARSIEVVRLTQQDTSHGDYHAWLRRTIDDKIVAGVSDEQAKTLRDALEILGITPTKNTE